MALLWAVRADLSLLYSRDHLEPILLLNSHHLPLPAFPLQNLLSRYYPSPSPLSKTAVPVPLDGYLECYLSL